jgi:hypothetical protein
MGFKKTLVAVALLAGAMGAQAATNLVKNGSFEANLQAEGTYTIYPNLTNWTGGTYGIELRNSRSGEAQHGQNFVELDTTYNSSMSQSIDIASPGSYLLSFWYMARPDNGTRQNDTNELEWSFGTMDGEVLQSWKDPSASGWTQFTKTFNFTKKSSVKLEFEAGGKSDSYGGSIDNISVTAVPEPETYAMLLAGLGLMGTIARRRNKKPNA